MRTASTDERPVLKLAQWRLMNENPLLDRSRCTSAFVVDFVGYGEICFIVQDEGRGLCRSGGGCSLPLSDPFVLFPDLVVD